MMSQALNLLKMLLILCNFTEPPIATLQFKYKGGTKKVSVQQRILTAKDSLRKAYEAEQARRVKAEQEKGEK